MARLTDAERKTINDTIWERTKLAPFCPKCKSQSPVLLDGYGLIRLHEKPFGAELPMRDCVPLVATACGHCGFIEFYATEKLGLSGEKRATEAATKIKTVIEELRASGMTEEEIRKAMEAKS